MPNNSIPILMYHSIDLVPRSEVMRGMHVTPKRFNFQMKMLNILGYKGLSLKKLKPYLDGKKTGKVVGLTFDDGYQNNLINAAPILQKYNFSATNYLVSQNIGFSNSWDIDKKITQQQLMTFNDITDWLNLGMDIGAHTENHVDLTKVSEKEAIREIRNCKRSLEDKFSNKIDDFCYPYGNFNDSLIDIVRESGYSTATSMNRGKVSISSNLFELPRIPITYHTLPHLFLAKILTSYEDKRQSL